jgi:hypothetical protein
MKNHDCRKTPCCNADPCRSDASDSNRAPGKPAKNATRDPAAEPPAPIALRGRGTVVDQRSGLDRRDFAKASQSDLDRRRGPGRRLSDFTKAAEEGEMNKEQFLFLMAIDEFKKANQKAFPTWTDVLEVIRLLGYRKTMPSELNVTRAEDWREEAMAPSAVRAPRWHEKAA